MTGVPCVRLPCPGCLGSSDVKPYLCGVCVFKSVSPRSPFKLPYQFCISTTFESILTTACTCALFNHSAQTRKTRRTPHTPLRCTATYAYICGRRRAQRISAESLLVLQLYVPLSILTYVRASLHPLPPRHVAAPWLARLRPLFDYYCPLRLDRSCSRDPPRARVGARAVEARQRPRHVPGGGRGGGVGRALRRCTQGTGGLVSPALTPLSPYIRVDQRARDVTKNVPSPANAIPAGPEMARFWIFLLRVRVSVRDGPLLDLPA